MQYGRLVGMMFVWMRKSLWSDAKILAKIIERCIGIGWFRYYHLLVSKTMPFFIISYPKLCFRVVLEPFPEAGSASSRSAVKLYFYIDIRVFSNFSKNIFSIDQKKSSKKMKIFKISKIENFQRKNQYFEILKFSIFEIL